MNKEKLITTLNKNLDVGHYVLMDIIVKEKDIGDLWQSLKIRGWREALIRKNLIHEVNNEYYLTDNGKDVYSELNGIVEEEFIPNISILSNGLDTLCKEIVDEVNMKILQKTGTKRMSLKSGKVYNCSVKELQKRLLEFADKFKNSNFEQAKRAILSYTDDVLEGKVGWARTILYFIWKEIKGENGKIKTISDMQTYIETLTDKPQIIDKSKLFG